MFRFPMRAVGAALALAMSASLAQAQVKVGVDLSTTGPAATIGISSRNAFLMWPKTLGGQPAEYIFLDDASDPGTAVRNIRRMISEDKVDVIVGPTITPAGLAALDPIAEAKTPMVALVGSASIVEPQTGARTWAFKMASSDVAFADVVTRYMADNGVKTLGFLGFADGYGESWIHELTRFAELRKIKLVAIERYNRTDTSVTGQVLKLMALHPDGILIAGAGTPTVLPQRTLVEHHYPGKIFQTAGIGSSDFLKVGGKDVEGTLFPTQPVLVAMTLPNDNPMKKSAVAFVKEYEARYGPGSANQFSGDAAGVYPRLNDAVGRASKVAKPGTPEFRAALRDALENTKELVIPQGIVNTSPQDHVGLDQRAVLMGTVKGGKFVYLSQ